MPVILEYIKSKILLGYSLGKFIQNKFNEILEESVFNTVMLYNIDQFKSEKHTTASMVL